MEFAKEIHGAMLKIMKSILDMAEFKFGKESGEFRYFKKEVMSVVYNSERGLFERMNHGGLLIPCGCGANVIMVILRVNSAEEAVIVMQKNKHRLENFDLKVNKIYDVSLKP